jgi:hypothetical protein
MEPPIQAAYLRSAEATTWVGMVSGTTALSSICRRDSNFGNIVDPPLTTTEPKSAPVMLRLHFFTTDTTVLCRPTSGRPIRSGWKRVSAVSRHLGGGGD